MNKRTKIKKQVRLFVLLFLAWLIYAFFEFQFVKFFSGEGFVQLKQTSTMLSTLEMFLLTTFMYPILEEVIFRLPLIVKLANVVTSLLVATWYYSFRSGLISFEGNTFLSYGVMAPILISLLIVLFFFKSKYAQKFLDSLASRYYVPLVMMSIFLFAMAHFWKLTYDSLYYAVLFILVVYFTFGLFLSYVRVKFNFWAALFFHVIHNSIPYAILLYYSIKRGENLFIYI